MVGALVVWIYVETFEDANDLDRFSGQHEVAHHHECTEEAHTQLLYRIVPQSLIVVTTKRIRQTGALDQIYEEDETSYDNRCKGHGFHGCDVIEFFVTTVV